MPPDSEPTKWPKLQDFLVKRFDAVYSLRQRSPVQPPAGVHVYSPPPINTTPKPTTIVSAWKKPGTSSNSSDVASKMSTGEDFVKTVEQLMNGNNAGPTGHGKKSQTHFNRDGNNNNNNTRLTSAASRNARR